MPEEEHSPLPQIVVAWNDSSLIPTPTSPSSPRSPADTFALSPLEDEQLERTCVDPRLKQALYRQRLHEHSHVDTLQIGETTAADFDQVELDDVPSMQGTSSAVSNIDAMWSVVQQATISPVAIVAPSAATASCAQPNISQQQEETATGCHEVNLDDSDVDDESTPLL